MNGFGANVIAYDKFPDEETSIELGFTYVELDKLYMESDIISLHCPLNEESYKMIDKIAIDKMKTGVYLINTSRGKLIKTSDLIEKLQEGKIGGLRIRCLRRRRKFLLK